MTTLFYAAREPDEREAGLSLGCETQYYVPISKGPVTYSRGQASAQESAYILYVGPIDSIS